MKKILLLAFFLIAITNNAQTNLIKNGGFETELENWRGDVATISPYDKKSGNYGCTINQFVGNDWKGIDQVAGIPKKTVALTLTVWIKTEDIEGGKEAYNAGIVTAEFMNAREKNLSFENVAQIKGTTPWTFYKKTVLVPEGAKNIRIMLALAQTSGTIYFDDIKAIPLTEEAYLNLMQAEASEVKTAALAKSLDAQPFRNGNFEEDIQNWTGSGKIVTSDKKEGTAAVAIQSDMETWTGIDQSATIPEGIKTIEISGWLKANNIKPGKEPWNNGIFALELTNEDKSKAVEDQLIGSVTGTTDWIAFKKLINVPQGAKKLRIMLALSACTGSLLADAIQIKMLTE